MSKKVNAETLNVSILNPVNAQYDINKLVGIHLVIWYGIMWQQIVVENTTYRNSVSDVSTVPEGVPLAPMNFLPASRACHEMYFDCMICISMSVTMQVLSDILEPNGLISIW